MMVDFPIEKRQKERRIWRAGKGSQLDPGYGISWFQLIFAALGDNRCERRHGSNKLLLLSNYIELHWATSSYIELYRATSSYIELHWATSTYIELHRAKLSYIEVHRATSSYVKLHRATSSYIELHVTNALQRWCKLHIKLHLWVKVLLDRQEQCLVQGTSRSAT